MAESKKKAQTAINLVELFGLAFRGQVAPPFPNSKGDKLRVEILNGYKSKVRTQKAATRFSAMGTPIFMPCKINGYAFPDEPLITIELSKTIVSTELVGYDGSVKENMGLNDYEIVIQGVAANHENDDYPDSQIRQLREIAKQKKDVSIESPLLALFGISRIAVQRLRLPAVEGQLQFTGYELQCLSDIDISLIIRDAIL